MNFYKTIVLRKITAYASIKNDKQINKNTSTNNTINLQRFREKEIMNIRLQGHSLDC